MKEVFVLIHITKYIYEEKDNNDNISKTIKENIILEGVYEKLNEAEEAKIKTIYNIGGDNNISEATSIYKIIKAQLNTLLFNKIEEI